MSPTDDPLTLAEQAEAEAAEAEAQAADARARAERLRSGAATDSDETDESEETEETEPEAAEDFDAAEEAALTAAAPDEPKRRLPLARIAVVAGAALLLAALLTASGLMLWQGRQASEQRAQRAEFAAAARQGVTNLMSLNFTTGDADIQRLIDSTTGQFREDFEKSKNDFLTVMKESKVVTTADVKATAVDTMTKDSAVVLVAASSEVSNAASAKQPPRGWRLSVTVERDNGQLKMSKVEFVP